MAKLELVAPRDNHRQIVDEFGALEARIDWAGVRRHEALGKTIRGWYAEADPATGFTATGDLYRVSVGPRSIQRRIISMGKVCQRLGRGVFFRHCSMAIGKLEELMAGSEVEELTIPERTGGRKLEASLMSGELQRAA